MNILYFGNRDYWDLEKAGHTRYENIFKTLMNLNKHQVLYTRIYGWKHFIKNFIHYSKNICRIKIKFSKNTLFILEIKNNKLGILSIYTNNRENVLIDTISSLENLADFQQRNKWIWFNNYLYASGTSKVFIKHFNIYAKYINDLLSSNKEKPLKPILSVITQLWYSYPLFYKI